MNLLDRVKRKLKISWSDDDTDIELADMIEDIITCQNQLLVERKMQDADDEEEGA